MRFQAFLFTALALLFGGCSGSVAPGGNDNKVFGPDVLVDVACDQAQLELPLATHWSNSTAQTEGASDQITLYNPAGPQNHRIYNYNFLPEYDKYIGDTYSVSKWSDALVREWSLKLCTNFGLAIEMRKPSSYSNWVTAKASLKQGRKSIQVLPIMLVAGSLVTVFLPPGWMPDAVAGSYPVLFSGFYDINDNMKGDGLTIVESLSQLWKAGHNVIGVTWNGGGGIASRTFNDKSYDQFNEVVKLISQHLGGDSHRIMTIGASRGGSTALRLSANPKKFNYKVLAAYAAVAPAQIGELVRLTSATVPYLLSAAEWSLGIDNTWQSGWVYPTFEVANSLAGLNRGEAHLKVLTGYSSVATVDSEISLSSEKMLNALKAAGTRVYLEIGSHDFIVPGVDQFRYAKLIDAKGIPNEQRINYLAGHWNHSDNVKVIVSAMTKIAKKESVDGIFQAGQKSYFRVNPVLGKTESIDGPRFTLEVPRYLTPSIDGLLIATGLPGTQLKISGRNNGISFEIKGTLAIDGTFTSKITSLSVGQNVINSVQLLKPGSTFWIPLDLSRSTTKWNPGNLVVEVLSSDSALDTPLVSGIAGTIVSGFLGADLSGANGSEFKSVSYGISE